MEFSDNLKRIRKENNISQEQFAEKLGVSRQAVSKWESGQSYPEMDKVIQICKLYNFNIDELLNQNIKQINEDIDSKKNMNKYIEGFLSYISKTVNMFCAMSFKQKIKCIFEQGIICILLLIFFLIFGEIIGTIVRNILNLLPLEVYYVIYNILEAFYMILAVAIGATIILYLFKIRYLDYYKIVRKDNKEEQKEYLDKVEEELNDKKEIKLPNNEKIIFRDSNDSQFKFITSILKMIVFGLKVAVLFISFWFICSFIGIIVATVISFTIYKSGMLFIGILTALLSSAVLNYLVLEVCYNFVTNRKASRTRIWIMAIVSLITLGLGIGMASIGVYNINVVENKEIEFNNQKSLEIEADKDLYIYSHDYNDIEFIQEDRENIKIVVNYCDYFDIDIAYNENKEECYVNIYSYQNGHLFFENLKQIVADLNNRQIKTYQEYKVVIYASEDNIKMIKDNL